MEREPLEAVTEAVEEILGIEIDEDMVEGDVLEIEIGIVIEDTEVEVDASMEAIAGNQLNTFLLDVLAFTPVKRYLRLSTKIILYI